MAWAAELTPGTPLKVGVKRSQGGLLACLQHDSKLLKRGRGEAEDQAEGGHGDDDGDGDGVEEGGGRGGEKVEQVEDAAPADIERIDEEEAADDEDVCFSPECQQKWRCMWWRRTCWSRGSGSVSRTFGRAVRSAERLTGCAMVASMP